jgi:hypothetical protein
MKRTCLGLVVALISTVAVSCTFPTFGSGGSGNYFYIQTWLYSYQGAALVASAVYGGVAVQASLYQGDVGATGTNSFYPTRFTDSFSGNTSPYDDAVMPGYWRGDWVSDPYGSGCSGQYVTEHVTGAGTLVLHCDEYQSFGSDYSYNTSGSLVYTGGADKLLPEQSLGLGESITSADGRFRLLYQEDGNLVLYDPNSSPIWASHTDGTCPNAAGMQTDGNFVVYDCNWTPVWASNTGSSGSWLMVQSDGDVAMYNTAGALVWHTGTGGH